MRTPIFLISLLLMAGLPATAQFRFGIKAGLATSNPKVNDQLILNDLAEESLSLSLSRTRVGYQAGAMGQFRFGFVLLQPEVLYEQQAALYHMDSLFTGDRILDNATEVYHMLGIPVLIGIELGPLRLQAGPKATFPLGYRSDLEDQLDYYRADFNSITWGYELVLGLDVWNWMLDFRFERKHKRLADHMIFYDRSYQFDKPFRRLLIQLSYRF